MKNESTVEPQHNGKKKWPLWKGGGVRGVGLKSLDLVWTVLRKAEIELQIEHTLRFFGGLFFGLKSLDLVWTVLRKAEIELQIEHTLRFFGGLFFGLKSLDLVWTVLRKAEIEL